MHFVHPLLLARCGIGSRAMPTRPFKDTAAGPLRELGLPGRAVTALTRAGVRSVAELAVLTREDLAAIDGLGSGMIAAIRLVVPEPPTSGPRSGASPQLEMPDVEGPADDGFPAAPPIPSFASMRAPQRRTALDLLMPGSPTEPSEAAEPSERFEPSEPSEPAEPWEPDPAVPAPPRPAEYADLVALGAHVLCAATALPVRLMRWSVRVPAHSLRWLLGGRAPRSQG